MWPVGSWFPDQGSDRSPLQWKCGVLTTGPPGTSYLAFFFKNLFVYFWLFWVFFAVQARWGCSLVAMSGLLIEVASLVTEPRL